MALYAFDGTWNEPDQNQDNKNTNTNVFRFAEAYALAHGDSAGDLEPHYIPGVGTRFGKVGRVVGGFTGAGGRKRVEEMLKLCAAEFAAGDKTVDIIGFSRGAALALHFANKLADGVMVEGRWLQAESIRFLGIWDTVPAFGIPGAYIDWAQDINVGWDLDLPPNVQLCSHVLARHERRQAFDVHRLDPRHKHANVHEVWFRGVHSDIGGGNGNLPLNAIPLRWMMEEARLAGIPFTNDQISAVQALEDTTAPIGKNSEKIELIDRAFHEHDVLHPSAANTLAIGASKTVPVDSRVVYDFSGLIVESGASYTFSPDMAGSWQDASIKCGASGWPDDLSRNESLWGKIKAGVLQSAAVGLLRRVRTANWFELCACPGFDDDFAFPVGKGQHAGTPWQCPRTAPLNFFANDALHPVNQYRNNNGSLNVTVTRVA